MASYPISIFYDLETSTTCPLGQIMNFCFIVVDGNFEVLETFYEKVKVSRTQLPEIDALLANRIKIIEHQKEAKLSEFDACKAIMQFFDKVTRSVKSGSIPLIGFNSNKFDFEFLRTTLYRNGFIPPTKRLVFRDLLHLSRKLGLETTSFSESTRQYGEDGKVSFKLQSVTKALNLLKEDQTHDSKDDVLLTIALAKCFKNKFGIDIRDYLAYEPKTNERFSISLKRYIDSTKDEYIQSAPYALLDNSEKYALWIDLNKWREGATPKESIWYFHKDRDAFVVDPSIKIILKEDELAPLKKHFSEISLANYFTTQTCDVEARLSNIHPQMIGDLRKVIEGLEDKANFSKDLKALFFRWKLANYEGDDSKYASELKKYAEYRYGGALQLHKNDEIKDKKFHPSSIELLTRVKEKCSDPDQESREIAEQLYEFYENSPMLKACC